MKLGTRFYGAACLLMITIASLAEGGAFEPDEVVRVDTVTVQMTNVIRVDTIYVEAEASDMTVEPLAPHNRTFTIILMAMLMSLGIFVISDALRRERDA